MHSVKPPLASLALLVAGAGSLQTKRLMKMRRRQDRESDFNRKATNIRAQLKAYCLKMTSLPVSGPTGSELKKHQGF